MPSTRHANRRLVEIPDISFSHSLAFCREGPSVPYSHEQLFPTTAYAASPLPLFFSLQRIFQWRSRPNCVEFSARWSRPESTLILGPCEDRRDCWSLGRPDMVKVVVVVSLQWSPESKAELHYSDEYDFC